MLALLAGLAFAVPMQLDHQGRLLDTAGAPLGGPHDVELSLYDSATSSTPVWSEIQSVDFDAGYFAVRLGTDLSNPIGPATFDQTEVWVGIAVDGGLEGPRQRVTSVPYAVRAETATNVAGGVVDATAVLVDGTMVIDGSGTFVGEVSGTSLDDLTCQPDQVPLFNGAVWGCLDAVTGGGAVDWSTVTGKPLDFADDVDNDALTALSCTDGEIVRWDTAATAWVCSADIDTRLDEAAVDAMVGDNGYALMSNLQTVATTGVFADLLSIPPGLLDGDDDTQLTEAEVDAMVANNGYADAASLAAIATTGNWADLSGVPADLLDGDNDTTLTETEVDAFVANNGYALSSSLAPIATTGAWGDLSSIPADFADGIDNVLTEAAVDAFVSDNGYALDADISAVGKDGLWSSLINVPTDLVDGQISWAELTNKPGALSDGQITWGELQNKPADFADGEIAWGEVNNIPAGFADGTDDGITAETDPSVNALAQATLSCSNGQIAKWNGSNWACAADVDTNTDVAATWANVSGKPAGFADNVDNVGITSETDPTVNSLAKATLSCSNGQVAKRSGSSWVCANDTDTDTDTVAACYTRWGTWGCASGFTEVMRGRPGGIESYSGGGSGHRNLECVSQAATALQSWNSGYSNRLMRGDAQGDGMQHVNARCSICCSKGCYTAFGTNQCASGYTRVYQGRSGGVEVYSSSAGYYQKTVCIDGGAGVFTTWGSGYYTRMMRHRDNSAAGMDRIDNICAQCCRL